MPPHIEIEFFTQERAITWTAPDREAALQQQRAIGRLGLPEGWEWQSFRATRVEATATEPPHYACLAVAKRLKAEAEKELDAATYAEIERISTIETWRF